MYISKTPLRVSFFGGGTDYPAYFETNPSAVLGGSINKYIYTTALDLASISEQKFRISYRVVEDCDSIDDISHPVIREVLRDADYDIPTGFYTVSDLPGSTGLGSSSSFTVGFINLIETLREGGDSLPEASWLTRQAIRIERDVLGENVGVQDQTHAAYGGFARYDFNMIDDELDIQPTYPKISRGRMTTLNKSMYLVYTDIQRHASETVSAQITRTRQGSNADYLNTMYEMTRTGQHILENHRNDVSAIKDLGALLNQSWMLKQNLGTGVTNAVVDDIYNTGIDMGAYGGKLLGAGGGGFVMFLLNPYNVPKFRAEFGANNVIPVSFESSGSFVTSV